MTGRGQVRWIARLSPSRTLQRAARVLDGAKVRGRHDTWLVMLTNGAEVVVRTARPDDAGPLQEMHSRCSPESRYLRYFGTASQVPAALMPVLLGLLPGTAAVVAETRDNELVGLANLVAHDDGGGEVALLVEDSWQRHGLGTALLRRLVVIAWDRGLQALTAVTLRSNGRPARVIARVGLPLEAHVANDMLELRARLPNHTGDTLSPSSGCSCPSRRARTRAWRTVKAEGKTRPKPHSLHLLHRAAQRRGEPG